MKPEDLLKDLQNVLSKHGINGEGQKSGDNPEPNNKDADSNPKASNPVDPMVIANITDQIAAKLAKAVQQNKGLSDKGRQDVEDHVKAKIFTSWGGLREIEYPSDLSNLSKEEKIVTFFKALVYHKADPQSERVLRALVEGTDTEGGYLVPEELRTEVFRILPDMGVMRRIARVFPMSTDTLQLNSLTARPVAYWTAEYASKSTTSAEFGQVTLNANDLVCLLPVSEQLIADANINVVQFIIELFAEAIALEEDHAFFVGTGTGQPKGITQETITGIDAGGLMTFDTLIQLIYSVPQRVRMSPRAAFVGGYKAIKNLQTLKDNNGAYVWREGGTVMGDPTKRLPTTVHGYPFYEQNDIDEDTVLFGDWSYYAIGDRQNLAVRTTTEGGDAWRRNSMEIKAVERVDGRAILTTPFAEITNA